MFAVDRELNKALCSICEKVTEVFLCLQTGDRPALQHACPTYYFLAATFKPATGDSRIIRQFKKSFSELLDGKYYTSLKAYHWVATFLDPAFKAFSFMPLITDKEKRDFAKLRNDVRKWISMVVGEVKQGITNPAYNSDSCSQYAGSHVH